MTTSPTVNGGSSPPRRRGFWRRGIGSRSSPSGDAGRGREVYGDDGAVSGGSWRGGHRGSGSRRGGFGARAGLALRGLSGVVTAGLVVLAGAVVGASILAGDRPGPGAGAITGHIAVAVLAVILQVVAERRRGAGAILAALATLPLAAATLWFWWWS
jgi:hypothetical protein